MLTNCSRIAT